LSKARESLIKDFLPPSETKPKFNGYTESPKQVVTEVKVGLGDNITFPSNQKESRISGISIISTGTSFLMKDKKFNHYINSPTKLVEKQLSSGSLENQQYTTTTESNPDSPLSEKVKKKHMTPRTNEKNPLKNLFRTSSHKKESSKSKLIETSQEKKKNTSN